MVNEASGNGQYLDEDKYKFSVELEKEGKYYGVEGKVEHKQKPYKAELFLGTNLLEIPTGKPVDVRLDLDLLAAAITLKSTAELSDIGGDAKTDIRANFTFTLFDYDSIVGTIEGSGRWINGDMVIAESKFKLFGSGWWELGISKDYIMQETKYFLGISKLFSSLWEQNISGTIAYGNNLTPRFTCTISGNLITTQEIPAFTVVTSLTSSIDETDPSRIISEGTSQREIIVGGVIVPLDKLALLAPYIALASIILVATVIYFKRVKHRKEEQ